MSTDELLVEARARIIWGDEPASVRYFLTSNGMSTADAESRIQKLVTERTKDIRKIGIRGTCIGTMIVCVCTSYIFYELKHPSALFPIPQAKAMFFTGVVGLYGIWKLVNGVVHLVFPKSETRSITEVSE
jgi:hypothetical protein